MLLAIGFITVAVLTVVISKEKDSTGRAKGV